MNNLLSESFFIPNKEKYKKYGFNENRKIFDNDNIVITNNENITNKGLKYLP